jgi:signal transduction histidine kinase
MTGIISTAEILWEKYDKLNDKSRKNAAETIYKSAIRLESFDNNIRDLSKLSNPNTELCIKPINLSELIDERLIICRKLYIQEQEEEKFQFIIEIEPDVIVDCDQYYLKQTLDNLIINAITYCKKGEIKISLTKNSASVEFSIQDKGIGIPKEELYDIFGAFTVSSKTYSPAGGRGIGLALCKKVIEMHHGKIWAESNLERTVFYFNIPLYGMSSVKLDNSKLKSMPAVK